MWGVADSAPYLHDGRANTLDDAIRRHDGEAAKTETRYTKLAASDRKALLAFLNSLTVSPHSNPRKPAVAVRRHARPGDRLPQSNCSTGGQGEPEPDEL